MLFFHQDDNPAAAVSWGEIEAAAAIAAACLPLLGPVLGAVLRAAGLGEGEVVSFSGASLLKKFSLDGGRVGRGSPVWWGVGAGATSGGNRGAQDLGGGGGVRGGESGRPCGGRTGSFAASSHEVWGWEREVDARTRKRELFMFQHQASASRGSDAGLGEFPTHGINVTRDFRRFSEIDPALMSNIR